MSYTPNQLDKTILNFVGKFVSVSFREIQQEMHTVESKSLAGRIGNLRRRGLIERVEEGLGIYRYQLAEAVAVEGMAANPERVDSPVAAALDALRRVRDAVCAEISALERLLPDSGVPEGSASGTARD